MYILKIYLILIHIYVLCAIRNRISRKRSLILILNDASTLICQSRISHQITMMCAHNDACIEKKVIGSTKYLVLSNKFFN